MPDPAAPDVPAFEVPLGEPSTVSPGSKAADGDECRIVEVPDVGPVRVRGSGEWTEEDHAMFAEVVQAAKRRYIAEHGDPDA